jgi:hypothetical protein
MRSIMQGLRFRSFLAVLSVLGVFCWAAPATRAADVLTQHYNNARTGAVLDETILNTGNVNSGKFGKLWTLYADGQVVAQPLYVSGLTIDTSANPNTPPVKGKFNAIIIATMHNTVYVYDADKENRGAEGRTVPLWATWLGPPRMGGKDIDMWSTNDPEWGILGTPVVSDDKTTVYVVAWHDDGPAGLAYKLHALDLKNGNHRQPPLTIGVPSTDASNPCSRQSTFNPCVHKQRTALLLSKGVIYVGFGGDGNRGSLFGFDAQNLTQRVFWTSTPTGENGGIWQSGQGPAADADGNIYVMTGNGTFDADRGGKNLGNSFVKLRLEGQDLVVQDFFTPCNQQFLNQTDLDVGSAGPLLVPDTPPRIVSGGKEGVLYVLSAASLGKYAPSPSAPDCQNGNAVQQVQAFEIEVHNGQAHYGNIHGSPVFWKGPDTGRIYAWGENSQLKAFTFKNGRFQDPANPKKSAYRPPDGMPGGMLAISASGSKAGTGIVWAVVPLDGDANQQRGVKGIVLALDAQDITRTLWTSEQFADRDRLGLFPKFDPPMVAAGKLFVATYGDDEQRRTYGGQARPTVFPKNYQVVVYGLLQPQPPPPQIVNQDRDDVTVVRAATSALTLDTTRCTPADGSSMDCTPAVAEAAQAPSFHRITFPTGADVSGCALVRVTTASKDTGLANSSGIGFWSTLAAGGNQAAENSGRFVPKNQLKATGTATFLSGAPATLHEFAGVVNCPAAGPDALARLFKPYMQFEAPDNKIFRNWDLANNYLISNTVTEFDRSADVLRH